MRVELRGPVKLMACLHEDSTVDLRRLNRTFGAKQSKKIIQRLAELQAVPSFGVLIRSKLGRCHAYQGGPSKALRVHSLDLDGPWRLLIHPHEDQEGAETAKVTSVVVFDILDPH